MPLASIPSGFLLIDKPSGWTSFDVVAKLRGITGIKKIGHAGTLDPLATGLLVVAVGRGATRQIDQYVKLDKVYETTATLGMVSDSYDADGVLYQEGDEFVRERGWTVSSGQPTHDALLAALKSFEGDQEQVPPMYSAKKIGGKKLYELARQGKEVERKASRIFISKIDLGRYAYPEVDLTISCSTGTYVRSLVHDFGQTLGTGAYVSTLRRTQVGDFNVADAHRLEDFARENFAEKFFVRCEE